MSLGKFLTSKTFILNILGVVVATMIIIWITMLSISNYTNHGDAFPTPDYIGLEEANYMNQAKIDGVRTSIIDSVYASNFEPGSVIDQHPIPGHRIKEGRILYLTIAAKNPEQVEMPNLKDISLRQAKSLLLRSGLIVGDIHYKPSQYNDLVLDQKIENHTVKSGDKVNRGSLVDLTVGQRNMNARTTVPELLGYSLVQAEEQLKESKLNLGSVIYKGIFETEEDSTNAVVSRQSPASVSRKVRQGSTVDIWLEEPEPIEELMEEEETNDEIDNF